MLPAGSGLLRAGNTPSLKFMSGGGDAAFEAALAASLETFSGGAAAPSGKAPRFSPGTSKALENIDRRHVMDTQVGR
jgi:hypothetical protein